MSNIDDAVRRIGNSLGTDWTNPITGEPIPLSQIPSEALRKISLEALNLRPIKELGEVIHILSENQIKGISPSNIGKIGKLDISKLEKVFHKLTSEQIAAIPAGKLKSIPKKVWKDVPPHVLIRLHPKIVCELPGDIQRYISKISEKTIHTARTPARDQRSIKRPIDWKKVALTVAGAAAAILISLQLYLDQIRPAIIANQVQNNIVITLKQDGMLSDTGELTRPLEEALAQLPDDPLAVYATLIRPGIVSLDDLAQALGTSVPALIQYYADKLGIPDDNPDQYLGDRVLAALEEAYSKAVLNSKEPIAKQFLGNETTQPGRGH